jgi:hypothetical protein
MNEKLRTIPRVLALGALLLGATDGFAAPDDEEPAPDAAAVNQNFNMNESNFDQWVFQGAGNASAGRQRIRSRLKLQLDELHRVCGLTDAQKQKLALAAEGDTKRFFDQVEEVRQKFLKVRNDQNAFNGIWQEIQPLQMKQAAGLFGDKSFYAKTLRKTLNAEQVEKYQAVLDERRRFRYRASIEVAMATLESSVALRNEQREALVHILIDKTQPPIAFGPSQYDYYLVMYRLTSLKDVKPLFDERQWKLMQQQFNQYRGWKQMLIQNGVIGADDGKAAKSADADSANAAGT